MEFSTNSMPVVVVMTVVVAFVVVFLLADVGVDGGGVDAGDTAEVEVDLGVVGFLALEGVDIVGTAGREECTPGNEQHVTIMTKTSLVQKGPITAWTIAIVRVFNVYRELRCKGLS